MINKRLNKITREDTLQIVVLERPKHDVLEVNQDYFCSNYGNNCKVYVYVAILSNL